ncbi:hypothetical protein CALCODRAFT_312350 [Calocera cornea HHB12733]|uniref:Uncharacterized protein n=1 Tax=Calocera cornea HHB12733 TaxID=1353952 RepID=A0A165FD47_9BASI|nr:hypothetical protein CALCODRAFT_312350 [Calocera cornea HHB12733]
MSANPSPRLRQVIGAQSGAKRKSQLSSNVWMHAEDLEFRGIDLENNIMLQQSGGPPFHTMIRIWIGSRPPARPISGFVLMQMRELLIELPDYLPGSGAGRGRLRVREETSLLERKARASGRGECGSLAVRMTPQRRGDNDNIASFPAFSHHCLHVLEICAHSHSAGLHYPPLALGKRRFVSDDWPYSRRSSVGDLPSCHVIAPRELASWLLVRSMSVGKAPQIAYKAVPGQPTPLQHSSCPQTSHPPAPDTHKHHSRNGSR